MTVPSWLEPLAAAANDIRSEDLSRFTPPGEGERESAVLVLFGEGPEGPDILLIQRAATLRNHAGQPAFPGGGLDAGETPVQAALREAYEETGLDPDGVVVLGELPQLFIPFSGFAVTPVVAWWERPSPVGPVDPGEVASVVRVPLSALADPAVRVCVRRGEFSGPGFEVAGMLVWGFTAGLLSRLLELGGLLPKVDLDSLPVRDAPIPASPASSA